MDFRNIVLYIFLFLTLSVPILGAELGVEELLAKHQEASKRLDDLKADAQLDLQVLLGILPYREKLQGSYFYLKPDKHKLDFPDAPSYLQKAPSMFNWNLPDPNKFKITVVAPKSGDANGFYQLFYKPKNFDSSTQSIICAFDAKTARLIKQDTAYKDGGSVNLQFNYLAKSELPILDKVTASVSIPSYKLTGNATISFTNPKPNSGIDSAVFEPSK